jgi:mRNA interferase MazF
VRQGDIIKLNFSPTKGHEQSGYRPALIVSNTLYSKATNLTLVCPITNTKRKNKLHLSLEGNTKNTTGFVMCDQVQAVELKTRAYTVIDSVSEYLLWEATDIIIGIVDICRDDKI